MSSNELLSNLQERAFQFFVDYQDSQTGLIRDGSQHQPASIAATGFGLAAMVVGTEKGWISQDEAMSRVALTLQTCLDLSASDAIAHSKWGFLYHFVDQASGRRSEGRFLLSEISIIDTSILVFGALSAGEYFGGAIHDMANELYARIEWTAFLDTTNEDTKDLFYGGWTPELGFAEWHWGTYTDELILINILAVGSPTHSVSPDVFYLWSRPTATVSGRQFIRSWDGGLFTYQYAHLWLNLKGLSDRDGVDWWANSRRAVQANQDLAIKYSEQFKTYGPESWAVSPAFHPRGTKGYEGLLSLMADGTTSAYHDGTVSPSAAACALPFDAESAVASLDFFYESVPRLWGEYGFKSSFNHDQGWVAPGYYAIELGATLLAIETCGSDIIRKSIFLHPQICAALARLGFAESRKSPIDPS